ncbi:protein starmaker-like [Topomyia yanbarensis]|uniref:protein starmaker-like n=1 Tax=Topomyia yanbarensis TaxID=2498891 RepID=UPI00273A929E|nr:protein starmaker-like [Topomyia yanbarensis]
MRQTSGLKLFPGIFDPNPYIPRTHPAVLRVTSSAYQGPYVYDWMGGTEDGEVGYVKSTSDEGRGGFHHTESSHKKDGNDYEHEKQSGYGEESDDELDYNDKPIPPTVRKHDSGGRTYDVNEEQSNDEKDPNKQTTYGVAPTKAKKKPMMLEFGTRLESPGKTTHKKNHNGYETVIYHEDDHKSTEKGYDWRNSHSPPPKSVVIQPKEEKSINEIDESKNEGEEDMEEEQEDRDLSDDDDSVRESERSDYEDNYDSFRYGNAFSKNDDDKDHNEERSDERNEKKGGSGGNSYDYDEEVDREEIDEAANDDRYFGFDNDDYDEKDKRQYEYASEADYDAQ